MLTDEEKEKWDSAMAKANAKQALNSADLEQSFEQSFKAQGIEPKKAAQMAKIAKDGR